MSFKPVPSSVDFVEQEYQIGIGHDGMWLFPEMKGGRWGRSGLYDDDWRYGFMGMMAKYGNGYFHDRLSNRDGILCINHEFGRNTHLIGKAFPENLDDVRRKVSLDLEYLDRRSVAEDLKIMARTLPVMVLKKGSM